MFIAKYPIKDTSEFVTITVKAPEDMPALTLEKLKEYFGDSLSTKDIEEMLFQSRSDKSKMASWSVCAQGF